MQEYLDAAKSGGEQGRTAGVAYNFQFYVPNEEASTGFTRCEKRLATWLSLFHAPPGSSLCSDLSVRTHM